MMQLFRKNVKFIGGVIIVVVAAFIGTIFLVWGRGGKSDTEPGVVAWVGKSPIHESEEIEIYTNMLQFYQNVYKGMSAAEIDRRFNIKKLALDNLINQRAVLIEAQKRGLSVSDEELRGKILENPAFQKDGKFDQTVYLQIISSINQTPEQFESAQRNDLLVQKLESVIKEGVKVTDADALDDFRRSKESVSLQYALITTDAFLPKVVVSENELADSFEKNRQQYFLPDRIEVEYVRLDPNSLVPSVAVNEKEVADYYSEHTSEFAEPKMVRARHILFKLSPDAPAEEDKKMKDRATYVLGKAKAGTDFSALAKEFSQDASGPRGGDLGYFSREQMVPEFAEAAFALSKGSVGDLVKTQFGYHVIKVEDIKEARTPTLAEARVKVEARLRTELARSKVRDMAATFNEDVLDKTFDQAAGELKLEVKKAGPFSVDDPVPGLSLPKEARESLFQLKKDEVSDEIQWGGSRYFFRVVNRVDGHLPQLAEVKEKVSSDLSRQRAKDLAKTAAESLRKEVDLGASLEKASAGKYALGKTQPFTRAGFAGELGASGASLGPAFALAEGAAGGPLEVPSGYIVFRVTSKTAVNTADFEKEKDEIKSRILATDADRFFKAWLEEIKKTIGVRFPTSPTGRL